ncbi:MAG TPA: acyl-CoA thioesterase [Leptospiraceae bacterium]|nr:acyl-CoA thioesterase [Leptospiraceae bacterium]HMW03465.1 acyl-CoA thioesterase [Leptospiraceae bacterium]HMX31598.1 acyl-CoA thioesterase [Leptospiraceae bacterium]HMY29615.1 acyl-CoA thioesterase [Leptospiraceae bacterium]HMZ62895.1 acyl-CoA thioesterase [Leptospiraceae bacterium]
MIITPIQIRFSDLDAMRRVNNSVYSSYLELGRMDFCKKYLEIQTLEDIPFVLVRVELDILKSLRTGEDANVKTWVSRIGNTSWDFSAEIINPINNTIYARAKTVQVYYDYRIDSKLTIPESFYKILQSEMQ